MPRPKMNRKSLHLHLPPDVIARAKKAAAKIDMTLSMYIKLALLELWKNEDTK